MGFHAQDQLRSWLPNQQFYGYCLSMYTIVPQWNYYQTIQQEVTYTSALHSESTATIGNGAALSNVPSMPHHHCREPSTCGTASAH